MWAGWKMPATKGILTSGLVASYNSSTQGGIVR
ncbi:hypothetical protein SAMN05444158_1772 [Bradyrhizobium canariense]|uniref:Uncharacterized protein n=1 Tax=Bradyrhizobium canariense TaxID=255045 RepID=A0A1H1RI30_9BRAD|nr:hypothetical protein SAMN05444158_1772 [Bradyrhizobium canariense]